MPTPTAPPSPAAPAAEPLLRAIGTFGLAAAIVNITVGGGIFRLPANVAGSLGAAAPLAYLVCAVAMGLIVLCIADAGSRVSLTGGPYAYIGIALGPYAGFLSGVLLWMLGLFATAAVATVFAASVGLLVPALAGRGRRSLCSSRRSRSGRSSTCAASRSASRLNTIATVAKLLPLLLVADRRRVLHRRGQPADRRRAGRGRRRADSLLLVFAFAGVESRSCRAARCGTRRAPCRAPSRSRCSASRALHRAAGVAQGILGERAGAGHRLAAGRCRGRAFGGWARSLLLAGAAISMFGYLGGMTLSMPRILFALARDGFLPRALAAVHPAPRPAGAIVVQSLLALALATLGHLRDARDPRQRLGARALPRMRAGGVAARARGLPRRRRSIRVPLAASCPGSPARHPVAADRADAKRVARLRRVRARRLAPLCRHPQPPRRVDGLVTTARAA